MCYEPTVVNSYFDVQLMLQLAAKALRHYGADNTVIDFVCCPHALPFFVLLSTQMYAFV